MTKAYVKIVFHPLKRMANTPKVLALAVLGTLLVAALGVRSKAKKHPLASIDSSEGLLLYKRWYDLPLDLRSKIHIDPELVNRVRKVEQVGAVRNEIDKLHMLDERRKLAEACLDTSADELLESVRQAQRDEESYLSEIKALENKESNG